MGREIRRVPRDWQHPRHENGRFCGQYIPMFDEEYPAAAARWKADFLAWEKGEHPSRVQFPDLWEDTEFWEYHSPPDPDNHRPAFTGEPAAYQVYETVTEGTPVSPVFETEEALLQWLIAQGHSEHAAREFVRLRSVPSGLVRQDGAGGVDVALGIDQLDWRE